eukprot:CAMPEP_0172782150 /NCGR_PEP_ID=MMETSP1074-20121228/203789_1 /TAXON_ID=2916 /ORGANISM="Ceratium fusus, Strain PA161109" /LENGTH=247 /DNA_ID=CAMNT_0013619133 /DNA_START=812 /DNA_END=1555 /DNA_ORIENTATION=+
MSGHACLCDGSNRRWPERDLVTFLDSKAAARACAAMCASAACVGSLSAARSVAVRSQPRPGLSCDGFAFLGKLKKPGQPLAFKFETGTDAQVTAEDTWSVTEDAVRLEGVAKVDRCSFMAKALEPKWPRACAAMCASSACVVSLSAARSVAVRSQPRPGLSCDGFDLLGKVKNSGQSLAFTSETGTDVQVTAEDTTDLVAAASSFGNHVSTLDGFKKLLEPWSPDDRVEGVAEADRRCSFMAKALLY